jgi:lysophospholipase L1-like esterase
MNPGQRHPLRILHLLLYRRLALIVVGSAALGASGCASAPDGKSAPAQPFTIVAFGDSTTAPREGLLKPYSQVLADELPRPGVPATVINAGVPGNTTAQAMARLESDVLTHEPDLVIIQFGINDGMIDVWKDPPATVSRVSKSDFEHNLRAMIKRIRETHGHVILMTPNPLCWVPFLKQLYGKPPYRPDDPQGLTFILADYAQIVRDVAKAENLPLVDVYQAFEAYGQQPGHRLEHLLPDGVHPNDAGHRLVGDLLIETIQAKKLDKPAR